MEVQNLKAQVDILVKILQYEVGNVDLSKYGITINSDGSVVRS